MIYKRSGCTKTLRSNNRAGVCGSACESPEAPPSHRAKGVVAIAVKTKVATQETYKSTAPKSDLVPVDTDALAKFRIVTEAMGLSPDELLNEFAQAWLEGARAKFED